jgi:hypothetical protein
MLELWSCKAPSERQISVQAQKYPILALTPIFRCLYLLLVQLESLSLPAEWPKIRKVCPLQRHGFVFDGCVARARGFSLRAVR